MIVLRLDRVGRGSLDEVVARCVSGSLVRREGMLFLVLADGDRTDTVRGLAYAGIRARDAQALAPPPTALVAAVGRSLAPVHLPLVHDVVVVRRVPLGVACAALLGRGPLPWRRGPAERARCRALLGGADAAFLWARRAWAAPAVLREPSARAALRPIVFDRASAGPLEPSRLGYLVDGAIDRWAFA